MRGKDRQGTQKNPTTEEGEDERRTNLGGKPFRRAGRNPSTGKKRSRQRVDKLHRGHRGERYAVPPLQKEEKDGGGKIRKTLQR